LSFKGHFLTLPPLANLSLPIIYTGNYLKLNHQQYCYYCIGLLKMNKKYNKKLEL
jgi:hypothetical protein